MERIIVSNRFVDFSYVAIRGILGVILSLWRICELFRLPLTAGAIETGALPDASLPDRIPTEGARIARLAVDLE